MKNLLDVYPELQVLKKLRYLELLLNAPNFRGRSELAGLSELAELSRISGLESLDRLKALQNLNRPYNPYDWNRM